MFQLALAALRHLAGSTAEEKLKEQVRGLGWAGVGPGRAGLGMGLGWG